MPEVRRLLELVRVPEDERTHRLHWSQWRRRHQAVARRGHMARRARQQGPVVEWPPVVQVVPATMALSGALWERLVPLLPPQKPPRGRPTLDHRRMVEGMLWVMRTGAPWRDLPLAFGPWQTLYSRYRRWCTTGVWAQIVQVLHTPDVLPLSA